MNPGRNDPCPCGSGKKFKKCCSDEIEVPMAPPRIPAKGGEPPSTVINQLVALFNNKRYAELENLTRSLTDRYPDSGFVWKALSVALLSQGKEAFHALIKVADLLPKDAEAHSNLGYALLGLGRIDEAVDSCQRALKIDPGLNSARLNLGNALRNSGRLGEAIACYRSIVTLDSHNTVAYSNLLYTLYFHPDFDEQAILSEVKHFGCLYPSLKNPLFGLRADRADTAERRLKIGYVSPDFRDHCQSLFTIPLLSNHDNTQFEIYCYAQLARPDLISERLSTYADVWRLTNELNDNQLAQLIVEDGIDILIDLTMHMGYGRPKLFAQKPAPIQVAWLAYPGTTGLPAMDYRLTDPWLDPEDLGDDRYTEVSLRLPDTFWCYDSLNSCLQPNALPALSAGYVTFGCLNNFTKVSDDTLCRWGQVMALVPSSRLILMTPAGMHRKRVFDFLGRFRVAAERVEFVEFLPRSQYLQTYHRIDLCLDTLPYNGHTTSLDAYWMGVPVVTQVGHTVVGRAGWSQLNNLDMRDLAAFNARDFVDIAATLATDLPRLSRLRSTLRGRMESSPLMDGKRFAAGIEAAYRNIWENWCNKSQTTNMNIK